jgi:hypothetical protein
MPTSHDPIDRLAGADPLRDGERLTEADQREADGLLTRILAEDPQPAARPRRRPRAFVFAIAATACALAAAVLVVDLVDEDASGPSVIDRAIAAVSDGNAIYHTVAWMRLGSTDAKPQRLYVEAWYGPDHSTHTKLFSWPRHRKGKLRLEVTGRLHAKSNGRFAGTGAAWDAKSNTIELRRVGRDPASDIPVIDPNRDPGRGMRDLQRAGRLHVAGTTTYAGRKVYRLVSRTERGGGAGWDRIVYLVDARTYYPVYFRWVSGGGNGKIVADSRFLTYERLPFDAHGRKLLEMGPHPGAKVRDYRN